MSRFQLHVYFRLFSYPSFLLNTTISFTILALVYQRKSTWSGRLSLLRIRIVITWQPHSQVPIPEFIKSCRTQKFFNLRGTCVKPPKHLPIQKHLRFLKDHVCISIWVTVPLQQTHVYTQCVYCSKKAFLDTHFSPSLPTYPTKSSGTLKKRLYLGALSISFPAPSQWTNGCTPETVNIEGLQLVESLEPSFS